jgi:hypothetical protein
MSMSFRTRTWIVLAGSATLVTSSATVAAAADEPPPPPESTTEEAPPAWPPADTNGEWLPVPEDLFPPTPLPACGSTVTISIGDVFEVEYQAQEQSDGTIRIDYRGDQTTDLVRESDGATVDELDTGGPWTEIISADGLTATFSVDGASIYFAYDEVEAAAFAAQGLPDLFYYETGTITERVVFPEDPAATTIVSAEILTDTARGVQDVCDMLDDAADESAEESADGDDGHSS